VDETALASGSRENLAILTGETPVSLIIPVGDTSLVLQNFESQCCFCQILILNCYSEEKKISSKTAIDSKLLEKKQGESPVARETRRRPLFHRSLF
jgi:hypothetical protein